MKSLIHRTDANGHDTSTPSQSDTVNMFFLSAGVVKTQVIPEGAEIAILGWTTGNILVGLDSTPAWPIADVSNGSGFTVNPMSLNVSGHTDVAIISDSASIVSVAYYKR